MTKDTLIPDDLEERLRVLYVWPQSVADHHADILTPRQIEKLYEVGGTADEASQALATLKAERDAAVEECAMLRERGDAMAEALQALLTADPVVAAYGEHALPNCECAFCKAGEILKGKTGE